MKPGCWTQLFPAVSQRSQLNVNVIGWRPFHVPGETRSVAPCVAEPEIVGGWALTGRPASGSYPMEGRVSAERGVTRLAIRRA